MKNRLATSIIALLVLLTAASLQTAIAQDNTPTNAAAKGYPTKEAFVKYLAENTGTPGWLYWSQHEKEMKDAKEGKEPYATWLKQGVGAVVPVSRYVRPASTQAKSSSSFIAPSNSTGRPTGAIEIVVTGGGTNTFWGGGDFGYAGSASVDQWR